jgi:hypothetical protein
VTQYLKADILNKQFHSVYTKEDYTNMPDKGPSPYPSMMKIQVNSQGVVKLLRGLRPFKATGPDEIPAFLSFLEDWDNVGFLPVVWYQSAV